MTQLELPEIETLRRDVEREFTGRKVKDFEVSALKSFPGTKNKADLGKALAGAKVEQVTRHGLVIIIGFDNDCRLLISLGEHGRLEKKSGKNKPSAELVGAINFTQGGNLHILDADGSSSITVVTEEDLEESLPDQSAMGLDLLVEPLSWVDFGRLMVAEDAPLRLLLVDPMVFVGIGEIYANEILFDSGLRHDRTSGGLSTQEIRRLYRSVVGILHDAIKYRGTSIEERPFADLNGAPGEYGDHLAVYNRAGEPSPRSREPIKKTSFKHQVVYYCTTQV